jgi:hypothetical protein
MPIRKAYEQVSGFSRPRTSARCKTVGSAYPGSNPGPAPEIFPAQRPYGASFAFQGHAAAVAMRGQTPRTRTPTGKRAAATSVRAGPAITTWRKRRAAKQAAHPRHGRDRRAARRLRLGRAAGPRGDQEPDGRSSLTDPATEPTPGPDDTMASPSETPAPTTSRYRRPASPRPGRHRRAPAPPRPSRRRGPAAARSSRRTPTPKPSPMPPPSPTTQAPQPSPTKTQSGGVLDWLF